MFQKVHSLLLLPDINPETLFLFLKEYPKELYNLDILDGSPPCSSFSTAGIREKGWGKLKKFREGQAKQILDDLFFEFVLNGFVPFTYQIAIGKVQLFPKDHKGDRSCGLMG